MVQAHHAADLVRYHLCFLVCDTNVTYDFVYVDEESFEKYKPTSFRQLVDGFREYKEKI